MGVLVKQWKGAWWIKVNHNGRRKAKRVGEGTGGKKAAEAAAIQIRAALAGGGSLDVLDGKPKAQTFADFAEAWLSGIIAIRCQASTCALYANHLKVWLTPAFGTLPSTKSPGSAFGRSWRRCARQSSPSRRSAV
jgi:integrase